MHVISASGQCKLSMPEVGAISQYLMPLVVHVVSVSAGGWSQLPVQWSEPTINDSGQDMWPCQ